MPVAIFQKIIVILSDLDTCWHVGVIGGLWLLLLLLLTYLRVWNQKQGFKSLSQRYWETLYKNKLWEAFKKWHSGLFYGIHMHISHAAAHINTHVCTHINIYMASKLKILWFHSIRIWKQELWHTIIICIYSFNVLDILKISLYTTLEVSFMMSLLIQGKKWLHMELTLYLEFSPSKLYTWAVKSVLQNS